MTSLHPMLSIGRQLTEHVRLHLGLGRGAAERRAAELLERGARSRTRSAALRALPAPVLRRHAPADRDRDRARLPAEAPDRGRADDGARRHRPGRHPPAARPAPARERPRRDPDHARSRRHVRRSPTASRSSTRGGSSSRARARTSSSSRVTRTRARCSTRCRIRGRGRTSRSSRSAARRRARAASRRAAPSTRAAPFARDDCRVEVPDRSSVDDGRRLACPVDPFAADVLASERARAPRRRRRLRAARRRPRARGRGREPVASNGARSSGSSASPGCGKSTLARAAVGLVAPTAGTILFEGRRGDAARRAARARASSSGSSSSSRTRTRRSTRAGRSGSQLADGLETLDLSRRRRALASASCCELVGLPAAAAERFPHEFSGGQRQRHRDRPRARRRPVGDRARRAARLARRLRAGAAREPARQPLARPRPRPAADLARPRDRAARRRRRLRHVPRRRWSRPGRRVPLWQLPLHPYSEALIARRPAPGRRRLPARGAPRRGPRSRPARRAAAASTLAARTRSRAAAPRSRRSSRSRDGRTAACWLQPDRRGSGAARRTAPPTCAQSDRRNRVVRCSTSPRTEEVMTTTFAPARERSWPRCDRARRRRASPTAPPAYGGYRHEGGGQPTLVVDNSFTIKTSDPQRAFDPTASIVDRAALRHALHVQGRRPRASDSAPRARPGRRHGREDLHLPAQAERPLRRRHAADRRPTSSSRSSG